MPVRCDVYGQLKVTAAVYACQIYLRGVEQATVCEVLLTKVEKVAIRAHLHGLAKPSELDCMRTCRCQKQECSRGPKKDIMGEIVVDHGMCSDCKPTSYIKGLQHESVV